jgi:hypothetical protein
LQILFNYLNHGDPVFSAFIDRIRQRYQLPMKFTPADVRASLRTQPIHIEEFTRASESPLSSSSTLLDMATQREGQPFLKWWHYFEAYSKELDAIALASRQRDGLEVEPLRILEIGVWRGGSLGLWREYFGSQAVIFGVDIDPDSAQFDGLHGQIRIGSQADSTFLHSVIDEMGGVDIVIDDGSHISRDVVSTLRCLWPRLNEGGLYFIEDLHTSYWPAWGGGLRRKDSSIEALKSLIDVLHQPYYKGEADVYDLGISRDELSSISFYDSVAVLTKRSSPMPRPFRGGSSEINS